MGLGHRTGGRAAGQRDKIIIKELPELSTQAVKIRHKTAIEKGIYRSNSRDSRKHRSRQRRTVGYASNWGKAFTEEEDRIIQDRKSMTRVEIAKALGRTFSSIRTRREFLAKAKRVKE